MTTFSLLYSDDGQGLAKRIDFDANDASSALAIAYQQARDRPAELWSEDRMLCTIKRTGRDGQVWQIGPAAQA